MDCLFSFSSFFGSDVSSYRHCYTKEMVLVFSTKAAAKAAQLIIRIKQNRIKMANGLCGRPMAESERKMNIT